MVEDVVQTVVFSEEGAVKVGGYGFAVESQDGSGGFYDWDLGGGEGHGVGLGGMRGVGEGYVLCKYVVSGGCSDWVQSS